jgi:hypothetical protein
MVSGAALSLTISKLDARPSNELDEFVYMEIRRSDLQKDRHLRNE